MSNSTLSWESTEVTVRCAHGETVRDRGDEEGFRGRRIVEGRAVEAHARRFGCSCRPPGSSALEATFGELDRFMAARPNGLPPQSIKDVEGESMNTRVSAEPTHIVAPARRRLVIAENNAITNDPCALCGERCDPTGVDLFLVDESAAGLRSMGELTPRLVCDA
jgi:hypothetical protein